MRKPDERADTIIQRIDRGDTEIIRKVDYQSDGSASDSEMYAARAFKNQPLSTTSEDNNLVRRLVDDSDQDEDEKKNRGDSVYMKKGATGLVNRANRDNSTKIGAQTPNNASVRPKKRVRDSSNDSKNDHISVYRY